MRNLSVIGQTRFNGGVNIEDYKIDLADNEMAEGTRNCILTKRGLVKKREGHSEVGSDSNSDPVKSLIQYIDSDGVKYLLKIVATTLQQLVVSTWTNVKTGLTTGLRAQKLLFYSMSGTNITTGTASSGTVSTLVDTGIGWTANAYRDKAIKITAGTGNGQVKYILENTTDTITIFGQWDTNPDGTSDYVIQNIVKSAIFSNGTDQPYKVTGATGTLTATNLGASYPKFTEAIVHLKRIFYIDPADPKKIRWTDPFISDGVLNAGTQNFWDIEESGVALGRAGRNALIVYTGTKTGILLGDDPDNFSFAWIDQKNGCIAPETVKSWKDYCYSLSEQGIYRTNGVSNIRVSRKIKPALDEIPRSDKTLCEAFVFDDKYHLSIPENSDVNYNNTIWVMDLIWSPEALNQNGESEGVFIPYEGLLASTFTQVLDSNNNVLLYFGSSQTSKVLWLYNSTYSDNGAPINWDVYTKGFNLGTFGHKKRLKKITAVTEAQSDHYYLSVNADLDQSGFEQVGLLDTGVIGSLYDTAIFDTATFEGSTIAVEMFPMGGSGRIIQFQFYNREINEPMSLYGWELGYKVKTYK